MLFLMRERLGSLLAEQAFPYSSACLRTTSTFYWAHSHGYHMPANILPFAFTASPVQVPRLVLLHLFFLVTCPPELLFQSPSLHSTLRCSWPSSSLYKILCCPMFMGSLFCRLNNEATFPCPLPRNLDEMLAHTTQVGQSTQSDAPAGLTIYTGQGKKDRWYLNLA